MTQKSHKQSKKQKAVASTDASEPVKLKTKDYEKALGKLHVELVKLQEWVVAKGLKVCIVFEGAGESKSLNPGDNHE